MLTFPNSYIPKLGPTALVSHTQTSIDSAHLDAGWKKCNTLGDAALESTPNHICSACRQVIPDFQGLLQQCEVYQTPLSLTALFQTVETVLKLTSC